MREFGVASRRVGRIGQDMLGWCCGRVKGMGKDGGVGTSTEAKGKFIKAINPGKPLVPFYIRDIHGFNPVREGMREVVGSIMLVVKHIPIWHDNTRFMHSRPHRPS